MSDIKGREAATEALELDAAAIEPLSVEIPVGNGPISGLATNGDGSRLIVSNYGGNSVSVIDTDRCRVIETIDGLDEPFALAGAGPGTDRAYVSTVSPAYDSIAVLDTATHSVVATHSLALSVSDLAVAARGRRVYASRNGANVADVAVLDTETGEIETIELGVREPGTTADCVCVGPGGDSVYVGVNGSAGGRLVVIGTDAPPDEPARPRWRQQPATRPRDRAQTSSRVVGSVDIGLPVRGIALSPDGALAYVASCDPDVGVVVDVVDTRRHKISSTRKLGELSGILTGLTLSADGDRAYLVSDDRVTVLCTLTHDIVGTLRAPAQPSCVVESPDGKRLYVADYSGAVTVAPVSWAGQLSVEDALPCDDVPAAWVMPELMAYEPALT
ncbi:YVTN family beta-propeller repeat protein [Mycobacterium rhizamassiliense]|jgi:YVTN family beta-propeller protein|uniref:YVTN family beta-propeller repeat protein n=1 Tax=Mycobacterium rhizamassiliense TaxID=1841860 RepID=A0A2U3NUZ6_9MYCO|nr:YncE family protein [Mycobacterium rhizamassiliense]SPM35337.1 YVTN family beta-propeller repeat protein [Mycobacterium rhizamassiliense]